MGRLPIIQEPSDRLKGTAKQWNEILPNTPATTLHNLTYLTELEHYLQDDERLFENEWYLSMKGAYSDELNKFLEEKAETYETTEDLGEGSEDMVRISEIDYKKSVDEEPKSYIDELLENLEETTYTDLRDHVRTSKPLKNAKLGEPANW